MEKHHLLHRRELNLLPIPPPDQPSTSLHRPPPKPTQPPSYNNHHHHHHTSFDSHGPSLDLQLSISHHGPYKPPPTPREPSSLGRRRTELLRWQAAEQMRLASIEKACAERVRELTRREMELAQSELAKARNLWERTKEEFAKAELIKQNSIIRSPHPQQVGSSNSINNNICTEITCRCCRRRFRP